MPDAHIHRHPGPTLAVASIAAFMTSIDMMVVTTALPALRRSLGGDVGALEWTVNAYLLAFACLLLTASGLGDRFGRRRVFTVGLAGFAASSVAAALAPSIGALVAARAAQGAAAALVLPLTLTMISEAFAPESRGRAIGIWGGVTGLGGVLGPILGAGVVQALGWSWIFWINVPIAVALIPAALRFVTETFGARQRLDVLGLVLASLGFLGISWGLVQASDRSVGSPAVLVPLAGGLVVVACFLSWERKTHHPMLPLPIFRNARFNVANTVGFCIYGSLCGAVFLTSQYFQIAQHHSPIAAALRFMPWPLPTIVVAPLAGSLAAKHGNRRFMAAGMAIQAVALAWFAAVAHADTPYVELCPPLVLSGIAIGMVFPAFSSEVVASVRHDQMGIAAGANATIRELGGVFGVALVGLVFASPAAYATAEGFATGFVHAIWACVALTTLGAVVAAGALRWPVASAVNAEPAVGAPVVGG
ncbi:MFS transporter [Candidatus Solirubrobacter pratensis]|uniref:MFS transporter n=1 Tax=Candidatus Solirubrobacter pratensis TaxID=1298857 RepID=UPI0004167F25|nr:MFS transporter [Candidatus Solirubrobacter pratensis]